MGVECGQVSACRHCKAGDAAVAEPAQHGARVEERARKPPTRVDPGPPPAPAQRSGEAARPPGVHAPRHPPLATHWLAAASWKGTAAARLHSSVRSEPL